MVEQLGDLGLVHLKAGDQILLRLKFVGVFQKKPLRGLRAFVPHSAQAVLIGRVQNIDLAKQLPLQRREGVARCQSGTPVKNGIAFPSRHHQACIGENFQVVAHARLFNIQRLCKFQYAVGIAREDLENRQAQIVSSGFKQLC